MLLGLPRGRRSQSSKKGTTRKHSATREGGGAGAVEGGGASAKKKKKKKKKEEEEEEGVSCVKLLMHAEIAPSAEHKWGIELERKSVGKVAVLISDDAGASGDDAARVKVATLDGSYGGEWPAAATEPAADPRTPEQRRGQELSAEFMAACFNLEFYDRAVEMLEKLGMRDFRGALFKSPSNQKEEDDTRRMISPIDAIVHQVDAEGFRIDGETCRDLDVSSVHGEFARRVSDLIAGLQGAGSRVTEGAIRWADCRAWAWLCQLGLDLSGMDVTEQDNRYTGDDSGCDGGCGGLSETANQLLDGGIIGYTMEERTEVIMHLLRAGADMWPFHVPGVTADKPPTGEMSERQYQVASILWPEHFPCIDNFPCIEGCKKALIDAACGLCADRLEQRRVEQN
jgi:hypothetical protein